MKKRSCPCNYGEPCDSRCTCINEFSSFGCRYCCSYGNLEQRQIKAEELKKKLNE